MSCVILRWREQANTANTTASVVLPILCAAVNDQELKCFLSVEVRRTLVSENTFHAIMADVLAGVKTAEATSKVALHPLVLLTASDLLTRHRLRHLEGPAVGLLLGQQRGNEITAEHAFTAKLHEGLLDHRQDWTSRRIEQCRTEFGLVYGFD